MSEEVVKACARRLRVVRSPRAATADCAVRRRLETSHAVRIARPWARDALVFSAQSRQQLALNAYQGSGWRAPRVAVWTRDETGRQTVKPPVLTGRTAVGQTPSRLRRHNRPLTRSALISLIFVGFRQ